jgi:hypothetical protein
MRGQETALDVGVVGQPRGKAEQLLVDVEMNRRLVVCRRHQNALLRRNLRPHYRRRVQVGEEDEDIVLVLIALDVLEQRRAPWALLTEPLHLVVAAVGVVEDPFGVAVEGVDVARP